MEEAFSSYQGPDVDERTKRVILSSETSPLGVYEAAFQDLKEQEQRLNAIGREHVSGIARFAYRVADRFIGVTSFDYRVKRQQAALLQATRALESRVGKYKNLSESSLEELRELRKIRSGARVLRAKYTAMESSLLHKEQELLERIEGLKEQASKNTSDFGALKKLEEAETDLEDYRTDLEQVGEERSLVTSKFIYVTDRITSARQQKLRLDAYLKALRQKYFRTTILESKLTGLSQQEFDPVGTMEVLIGATRTAQGVDRFTDAAVQIQLEGIHTALNLPEEEYGTNGKLRRNLRELERRSKVFDRDLEELADRILEEETQF